MGEWNELSGNRNASYISLYQTGNTERNYSKPERMHKHKTEEIIFNCNSGGIPHQHCMDIMIAERVK